MSFLVLLKKIASISIVSSSIVILSQVVMSLTADKEIFAKFTYYLSLSGSLINILPFGLGMLIVVMRFNQSTDSYARSLSSGMFVITPLLFSCLVLPSLLLLGYGGYLFLSTIDATKIAFLVFFNVYTLCLFTYYRVSQSFSYYAVVFLLFTFINSASLVIMNFLLGGFSAALTGTVVLASILSILSVYKVRKQIPISISLVSYDDIIKGIKYGLPIVLSSFTMSFLIMGDKLVLGSVNPDILADYAVVSLIASVTLFLVNNYASAWGGYLSKVLVGHTQPEKREVYGRWKPKILYVVPLSISVICLQFAIYHFLYEKDYSGLSSAIVLLSAAYFTLGVSKFFIGFMNFEHRNSAVFMSSLAGVCVIISLISFGIHTPFDMALAVALGTLVQLIICFFYVELKLFRRSDV